MLNGQLGTRKKSGCGGMKNDKSVLSETGKSGRPIIWHAFKSAQLAYKRSREHAHAG